MPKNNVVALKRTTKTKTAQRKAQVRALPEDPELQNVVAYIERSGKTLKEISTGCGVSTSCMRNWKSGKTRRAFGVTMTFVMTELGYERGPWMPATRAASRSR